MKKIINTTLIVAVAAGIYGCSSTSGMEDKKNQLAEYKKQLVELKANIAALEKEIAAEDPTALADKNTKILVATAPVTRSEFSHEIEIRGSVASKKNVMISAETMGRIQSISVKEGQHVKAGQLLIKLNADILENNVAEVKTQLELATAVYERQANLWKQNIGTEIQYLQAKNNKESLERRLSTLKSQLDQAYVRAPFSGVVDDIPVKVGEMAQPGLPLVRVVNPREMYISADVPEIYLGKFAVGDPVSVFLPVQDKTLESKVTALGQVVNEQNRTFKIEVSLPTGVNDFRPNQVAVLRLTDYKNEEAITLPTKIIQSDTEGKFVFVASKKEGKQVAKKVYVKPGKSFENKTEILSGLSGNEKVITNGYRDVSEGVELSFAKAS
ncbi:efflux RND transporter periplasmic adaptor subunit [Marinoscillum furvescens]|uniref:RND family efflux transporter MFP subunit n=1 Tax=Marinoscillum furvescens DSM 4134 TaxID=1122208 RepID=A0A3D9L8M3_MARFU|nr:efflux RND transporter periplasmic adaptor subunit [Marinoscillum furvescens]REE02190.1 RND family efflux transporter MFP subunit [Marinoscillum furvescens DSM 4134]